MVRSVLNIEKIVYVIWVASLMIFASLSFSSLSQNFTIHHYRQAQTAMTALYLPFDGFNLGYSTPIMGFPWTVPLEFPIFQWLAVLAEQLTGADLIVSGKTINILCHIINNFLIIQIFKRLKIDSMIVLTGLIFYNFSPFYLVFDSAFLIDSFSLFLSFTSIFFLTELLQNERIIVNGSMFFLFASLTGLSKSTTFIGVLTPITAVLLIHQLIQQGGFVKLFRFKDLQIRKIYAVSILFLFAFVLMYKWVSYTDDIKMLNPLSSHWTSVNTISWNFGTLQQRLSFANWKQYFTYSMLAHPVFYLLSGGGLVVFYFFSNRPEKIVGLCMFLFFITPLLIFFNLFFIHTYYSISNIIFLNFLLGLIVAVLMKHKTLIIKTSGIALGIFLLFFSAYRSYAFRSQVLKNEPEPGVYGHLNKLSFKPGMNDVIVIIQPSRDPFLEFYFKCRGINLNQQEYETYGKVDKLKKLSGNLSIRMICIVDEAQLHELPYDLRGILPDSIKHLSISHKPESYKYYNFFWY
jgi:hypothetical protein